MPAPTLAQLRSTVDVSNLSSSSLWHRMVLEQSLATAIGILAIGAVGALILMRTGRTRAATGVFLLGIGAALAVGIAGAAIETVPEALVRRTREFVAAVAAGRTTDVDALVEPQVALRSAGESIEGGRDLILGVTAAMPAILKDHAARPRGAERQGVNIGRSRVTIRATVSVPQYAGEAYSSWDLSWRQGTDGAWRIFALECISIFGQEPGREWVGVARQIANSGRGQ